MREHEVDVNISTVIMLNLNSQVDPVGQEVQLVRSRHFDPLSPGDPMKAEWNAIIEKYPNVKMSSSVKVMTATVARRVDVPTKADFVQTAIPPMPAPPPMPKYYPDALSCPLELYASKCYTCEYGF